MRSFLTGLILIGTVVPTAAQIEAKCEIEGVKYKTYKACAEAANYLDTREQLRQDEENRFKAKAVVYVRQNFGDLKSFTNPQPEKQSKGLLLSAEKDRVKDNSVATVQGLVALGVVQRYPVKRDSAYLSHTAFGIYTAVDHVHNKNVASKNVNLLTSGARYEFAYANLFDVRHHFGFSADLVSEIQGDTRNYAVSVDYFISGEPRREGPNTIFHYFNRPTIIDPNKHWMIAVVPRLRAEYRGNMAPNPDPIFFNDRQVMRLGSQVSVSLFGNFLRDENSSWFTADENTVPMLAARSLFKVSYGWWADTLSGREYSLFEASYTYNLDAKGLTGITLAYQRGDHDATGELVDTLKLTFGMKRNFPIGN